MRVLALRLDAPLVSFGSPMVDQNGVVRHKFIGPLSADDIARVLKPMIDAELKAS